MSDMRADVYLEAVTEENRLNTQVLTDRATTLNYSLRMAHARVQELTEENQELSKQVESLTEMLENKRGAKKQTSATES